MKPRELLYLFGLQPKPRIYPYEVVTFDWPGPRRIQYAQWLHPRETRKILRPDSVEELRKYIAPGDVAIDIGAHTGDTTIPMALAAGPAGCVLALEPNPYVFAVLKKNAELNAGQGTILPLMFAATPESGDLEFEYSDPGFCNGGRHEGISKWRHAHAFKLRVRGENLPAYLAAHFPTLVPRLRFLKVDAEGYDYQVLASLREVLAAQRPFVRAEVFKWLSQTQRERLYDYLVGLGYDVFRYESEACHQGPRLGRGELMRWPHYDVFCIPRR